ncbi:MAG: hypothetical protein SFV22_09955 [Saprospiraceae bacterium]|nr:hypothetical protein [Saprospiraceae bacterium]
MKKKIESLLQDARLVGNALYERLNMGYQSARNTLKKATAEKAKAKTAYKNAAQEENKKNRETILALRTAFKQAKYMQRYHRAALELAEYRLSAWLENWAEQATETPGAAQTPKSAKPAAGAKRTSAGKRMPKSPAKPAGQP